MSVFPLPLSVIVVAAVALPVKFKVPDWATVPLPRTTGDETGTFIVPFVKDTVLLESTKAAEEARVAIVLACTLRVVPVIAAMTGIPFVLVVSRMLALIIVGDANAEMVVSTTRKDFFSYSTELSKMKIKRI